MVLEFIRTHESWAIPIVFLLAFAESMAVISLLVPATVILLGIGGLVAAAGIDFWPIWAAAALGAILGDCVSYWLGFYYHREIAGMWPMRRHPHLLERGHAFFRRWGAASVFLGRFFGPLRCVMPLVAGVCAMRQVPFQVANVTSGLVWATGVLAPGTIGINWLT